MNKFFYAILIITLSFMVLTVTAAAQTAAPSKIAIINTFAFGDEKEGITKYVVAVKTVNAEFAPVQAELETMNAKLTALAKDIETLRSQAAAGKIPVDERAAQAKVDEAEKIQREIKFKSDDAKIRFDKRQAAVVGPVMQDIGKILQEFAKQKGFTVIFDIAKDEAGFLVAIGDEKVDITKEFVAYYNTRPATPAAPK